MKENKEWERNDLKIGSDLDVDTESGTITAYIETWFDVDKKFGTHTAERDDEWLNLYADYSPESGNLKMYYQVDRDDSSEFFDYEPTAGEARLIKDMIAEKIREVWGQTPQEFCESFYDDSPTMGGI